ncbi:MAG TPA: MYXO-CTERM sorting domain-containing protein [Kofleriaceae bacterium]|nr:MYXO-CTERM sorting domain-containing protein [Kofleriaceae bacterium]
MLRYFTVGLALASALYLLPGPRAAHAACSTHKSVEVNGKMKKEPRMGKPEKTFGGQVLLSTKTFPTWSTSVGAYISKVRKNSEKKFKENEAEKHWKIEFIAFFKRPLDDMEVSIRLWDVSRGQKRMVSSFEQFLDRCATSYASNMTLKREAFGVNKQIVVTVESRTAGVLASGKFDILGKADKFTGKADFSDEIVEVKKPEEDEDEDAAAAKKNANATNTAAAMPDEDPVEEPLDVDDPSLYKSDLDPSEGFSGKPPEQRKSRGCGCGVTTGGDAAGSLLLAGLVLVLVRRRRASAHAR